MSITNKTLQQSREEAEILGDTRQVGQPGFDITPEMRAKVLSDGFAVMGVKESNFSKGGWSWPSGAAISKAEKLLRGKFKLHTKEIRKKLPSSFEASFDAAIRTGRIQQMEPADQRLFTMLVASAIENGVPESYFSGANFYYVYPQHLSSALGEYLGAIKVVGLRMDSFRNGLVAIGHGDQKAFESWTLGSFPQKTMGSLNHFVIHEHAHLHDDNPSAYTNGGQFASDQSPMFDISIQTNEQEGSLDITTTSPLMDEVLKTYVSGPDYLRNYLSYPLDMLHRGDVDGKLEKTIKVEVFAQLVSLYYRQKELMRTAMPIAFDVIGRIHGSIQAQSFGGKSESFNQAIRGALQQASSDYGIDGPGATGAAAKAGDQGRIAGSGMGERRLFHHRYRDAEPSWNALEATNIRPVAQATPSLKARYRSKVQWIWKWADNLTSLNSIPDLSNYLTIRGLTLGQITQVDRTVRVLYDTFKVAGEHAADIYNYLTTRDANPNMIRDDDLRAKAVEAKLLMVRVGEGLVARGLLDPAVFEANKGAYLPRLYLAHLLDDDFISAVSTGKRPSAMGYLKHRKDIPEHVRKVILGEIQDPAFLLSKGFGQQSRDMVILDWLSQISENANWVLPSSLTEWEGRRVTPFWLKTTADRLERQAELYSDPARAQQARDIAVQMRRTANAALARADADTVPGKWKQMPNTPRYGHLRGMVVRQEVYDDIVGNTNVSHGDQSLAESLLGTNSMATKITQLWKWAKVAANPPAQFRNAISNVVLLHLSGIPMWRLPQRLGQAFMETINGGRYKAIADKHGVFESTYAVQELYRTDREFRDVLKRLSGKGASIAMVRDLFGKLYDKTGDIYQVVESVGKLAKIIDEIEKGTPEHLAVQEAQKWLFDYSLVSPSVRYLRNAPVGMPFLTFYVKVLPRLLEATVMRPWVMAPYLAIPYILTAAIAGMSDVDDDDVEKLKKALPEWLRERGHAYILPLKDPYGRWYAMDFGYLLPWTMYWSIGEKVMHGKVGEALMDSGLFGGPLPDIISALKTNKDPFSKREIVNASDPPAKQLASMLQWAYTLAMPTWLTEYGAPMKVWQTYTRQVDKFQQPKSDYMSASLRMFGINLYAINPDLSRAENLKRMQFEITEIKRRLTYLQKNPNLTPDDRRELASEYTGLIKDRTEEMAKYAKETQVHPNLRVSPTRRPSPSP